MSASSKGNDEIEKELSKLSKDGEMTPDRFQSKNSQASQRTSSIDYNRSVNLKNTVDQKSQTTSMKSDKTKSKQKVQKLPPSIPNQDHGKEQNQDDKNTQRTSIFAEKPPINPPKVNTKLKTFGDQIKSPTKKQKPMSFDINQIQRRDIQEDGVKPTQLSEKDA